MMLFLVAAAVTAVVGSGCTPIDHEHILGRDITQADPALATIPPNLDLGPAPLPGKTRVFLTRELKRIAAEADIQAEIANDVCFTWPAQPISASTLAAALKKALAPRTVDVEVIDQSSWPAPQGDIWFPLSGAMFASSGTVFWRGYIRFGQNRRFDIWVRARVAVHETHYLAAARIEAGQPLSLALLRADKYDGPLTRDEPFTDLAQLTQRIAKFDIAPGTLITRLLVVVPHTIERGQPVTVVAEVGRARVEAQCISEESGSIGSLISVHNARTGRHLRAVVQSKAVATLATGDALGLDALGSNSPNGTVNP